MLELEKLNKEIDELKSDDSFKYSTPLERLLRLSSDLTKVADDCIKAPSDHIRYLITESNDLWSAVNNYENVPPQISRLAYNIYTEVILIARLFGIKI